ncbi:MAG: hypothetical protein CM15mP23_03520 [Cryomorphaceae bacterium]|nr:MAG: hypothetical protein CM15mP23_03520 [Cryomorphaceae bacterium]
MFDFDVVGDGSGESTFYFDDIVQTNIFSTTNDIYGCTYEAACNYNEQANFDDGSCIFPELNYDCDGNCLNDFDMDGVCDEVDYDDGIGVQEVTDDHVTLIKMIDILGKTKRSIKWNISILYLQQWNS